tara:strand:+ start:979 stop:1350 length:372 start_codon:yes stop_codon:yes gene_type:complete
MKKWNGTTGEVRYKSLGKGRYDVVNYENVLIAELDIEITPPYIRNTGEAQYENVNLICNAFNTIQKCDLLPSELLKQRDELLEAVKTIIIGMEWSMEIDSRNFSKSDHEQLGNLRELIKTIKP